MPRIGEMIESKFLKKEDAGSGKLFTICAVKQHNVAQQGAEPELKWCAEFHEIDKPLVLNATNMHLLEAALNSDNTDDWLEKAIVVFEDPNVSFGGKVVGGVRVDVNRTKKYHKKLESQAVSIVATAKKPEPARPIGAGLSIEDLEDDLPY